MKGSSKVIMGTTIATVVLLAVVLGLVLVLLAELYCSLLFRQRKLSKATKPNSMPERPETPSISQPEQAQDQSDPSPLSSFYAQGVLEAPRRFLFPKVPSKREQRDKGNDDGDDDVEKQKHGKLCQFLKMQSPNQIGVALSTSSLSSPSPSYISLTKPHHPNHTQKPKTEDEDQYQDEQDLVVNHEGGGPKGENLMYISNPIYDNDVAARASRGDTPFETPRSSPSRLDRSGSSGDEEKEKLTKAHSSPSSLPLSPMKELPEKACSVELRNAGSLGTSGSECNSHMGRSSTSSGSPYTSPSW